MTGRIRMLAVAFAVITVGCTSATVPSPSPTVVATDSPSAAQSVAVSPSPSPEPSDAPPAAALSAEGGDPVEGQLGSYTWRDGGSDGPWLPGAPITVGLGEPLSVAFVDRVAIGAWRVQARPVGATRPVVGVAEDVGDIRFAPPAVGTWSLSVQMSFADGSGTATYYWEVHVR